MTIERIANQIHNASGMKLVYASDSKSVVQVVSPVVELVDPSDLKSRVTVNTWNPVFTQTYSLIYNSD